MNIPSETASQSTLARTRVVIFSARGRDSFQPDEQKQLEETADIKYCRVLSPLDSDDFINTAREARILALSPRAIKDLDANILSKLPNLQGVVLYTTGYEWVDTFWLRERGIPVAYAPSYSTQSVAEHALGMLLSMSRRIHLSQDKARGLTSEGTSLRGWQLSGREVALIGLGRIGSALANLLQPFDCKLSFFDPRVTTSPLATLEPEDQIYRNKDVIMLCCNKTRGALPIVNQAILDRMRTGTLLVNPARSSLVDNHLILAAIRSGILKGYAVDDQMEIFSQAAVEPGRILQTCHTGWYSDEALEAGRRTWVDNILSMAAGKNLNPVE